MREDCRAKRETLNPSQSEPTLAAASTRSRPGHRHIPDPTTLHILDDLTSLTRIPRPFTLEGMPQSALCGALLRRTRPSAHMRSDLSRLSRSLVEIGLIPHRAVELHTHSAQTHDVGLHWPRSCISSGVLSTRSSSSAVVRACLRGVSWLGLSLDSRRAANAVQRIPERPRPKR